MLVKSSRSISEVNSQGNNHISVTHKITVQLEDQPHCSQQRVSSNLGKSGKLEKVAALVFPFETPRVSPFLNAGADL